MDGFYSAEYEKLHGHLAPYYLRWYHEKPMAITSARQKELRKLHRILYKCILFMAERYEEFVPAYMPLSDAEMDLLSMQARYPYRAGTCRPDYILAEDGRLLLCEITSRFFAHGIFSSYFAERAARHFMERFSDRADGRGNGTDRGANDGTKNGIDPGANDGPNHGTDHGADPGTDHGIDHEADFEAMLRYMAERMAKKDKISVLKSADKTGEIRLYVPFYERLGKKVTVYEAQDVEPKRREWADGGVISALNQRDILSFSRDTIRAMIDAGMVNDLRTVFLVHDKRFMSLWYEDAFTGRCLTKEETAFLRAHAIPTWLYGAHAGIWEDARRNKDGYILKHHRLGKSEKVYGGPITDQAVWEGLWENGDIRDMILQPFIRQRTFPTVWEGRPFDDYICGMMLCVDDRYFEPGMFRASSLPVTNIGDDRKICPLYTDDEKLLRLCSVL